MKENVNQ